MAGTTVETVAKAMNVTPRRVQQLVKEGMPKGARGEYDLGACLVWYIRYLQAALDRASPNGTGSSASEERSRLNRAQAEMAELELQERRGNLVDRKRMQRAMAAVLVMTRESLLAIPDRLAASLTGQTDESVVRLAIDAEVRNSLESLVVTMGDNAATTSTKH